MSKKSRALAENRSRGSSIASRGAMSDAGSDTGPGNWNHSEAGDESGARQSEGSVGNRVGKKAI